MPLTSVSAVLWHSKYRPVNNNNNNNNNSALSNLMQPQVSHFSQTHPILTYTSSVTIYLCILVLCSFFEYEQGDDYDVLYFLYFSYIGLHVISICTNSHALLKSRQLSGGRTPAPYKRIHKRAGGCYVTRKSSNDSARRMEDLTYSLSTDRLVLVSIPSLILASSILLCH